MSEKLKPCPFCGAKLGYSTLTARSPVLVAGSAGRLATVMYTCRRL